MSLFRCEMCGCVDSVPIAYEQGVQPNTILKCTSCQGRPWHRYFEKRPFDSSRDVVVNHPSLKVD